MSDEGDDYEVGYKRPPKQHQWKPGQSGNGRGRRKGAKSLKTDLAEVLAKTVSVKREGKAAVASMQRLILENLSTKAAKGDTAATKIIMQLTERALGFGDDSGVKEVALDADDQEVLVAYIAKEAQRIAGGADEDV